MNTECKKCKAAMPPLARATKAAGIFERLEMTITGYRCTECGHWNNLNRRKPEVDGMKVWTGEAWETVKDKKAKQ